MGGLINIKLNEISDEISFVNKNTKNNNEIENLIINEFILTTQQSSTQIWSINQQLNSDTIELILSNFMSKLNIIYMCFFQKYNKIKISNNEYFN